MEKEINSNAERELDEASLKQVTGGILARIKDGPGAVGGDDVAGPEKAYLDGYIFAPHH